VKAKTVAYLALLTAAFISRQPAPAQDYQAWIRNSDRRDNTLIAEIIENGDLSAAIESARALGSRPDFRVQEIILAVGESFSSRAWEGELILRVILASVFPPELERGELERRLLLNREAMDFLVAHLSVYTTELKTEIVRLMAGLPLPEYQGALMEQGRGLTELLERQEGRLQAEQARLALTFLDTIEDMGRPEFGQLALSILERTRHPEVADRARATARSLLLDRED
jgi:hypothetical protein